MLKQTTIYIDVNTLKDAPSNSVITDIEKLDDNMVKVKLVYVETKNEKIHKWDEAIAK